MMMIGAGQKNLSTNPKNSSKIFKTMPPPNCLPQSNKILWAKKYEFHTFFSKMPFFQKNAVFICKSKSDISLLIMKLGSWNLMGIWTKYIQWGSWNNSLNWRKVFKCLNFIWQTWYLKYKLFTWCFCPWVFWLLWKPKLFFQTFITTKISIFWEILSGNIAQN